MNNYKIRLRTLITALSTGAVVLTGTMLLCIMIVFQRDSIEESTVQNNIAYARKLADTTDRYLTIAQSELRWSSGQIHDLSASDELVREADRLRLQSGFFNSVVIVNSERVVRATSPESLGLVGKILTSDASIRAVKNQVASISDPFISASGNYVVFLSQPIFSEHGVYLGYMGGTIYLKKYSILSDILSQHFYPPETDVKIVDGNGMVVFSHDPDTVGTVENISPEIHYQLNSSQSGKLSLANNNRDYVAGFARLRQTDWSIWISGSEKEVDALVNHSVKKIVGFITLVVFFVAILMIYLGTLVATPLERLANAVKAGSSQRSDPSVLQNIKGWYYEAQELKEAVKQNLISTQTKLKAFSEQAIKDPLTGLYNRRGFEKMYESISSGKQVNIIAIDIDHFKQVNDRFGHDAGDKVLQELATLLKEICRENDFICRFGGEEFVVVIPEKKSDEVIDIAERIRKQTETTIFPFVGHLTLSAGVASSQYFGEDINELLRRADEFLYVAKRSGRNAVVSVQNKYQFN